MNDAPGEARGHPDAHGPDRGPAEGAAQGPGQGNAPDRGQGNALDPGQGNAHDPGQVNAHDPAHTPGHAFGPDRARGPDDDRETGITLHQAQAAVDAWIARFEEGYWPPLANLARLVEEVGELAREINHLHGAKPKKPDEPDTDLGLELADILFVLIAIANEQGVDLDDAFGRVLDKYRVRDASRWTERR